MKGLGAVLRGFLATNRGEILSGGPQCVLHQHFVLARLPRIETFLDAHPPKRSNKNYSLSGHSLEVELFFTGPKSGKLLYQTSKFLC